MSTLTALVAVALVAVVTLGVGAFGLRLSRTTSDSTRNSAKSGSV